MPAGFGIEIQGLDQAIKDLEAIKTETLAAVKQAVLAGALMVESEAKTSIAHGSHTGHIYVDGNISHQASAPGETPATDTGALISSIQHWVSDDGLSIAVGSNLEYSSYLEFGTMHILPRPYLQPATDLNRDAIVARIQKAAQGQQ